VGFIVWVGYNAELITPRTAVTIAGALATLAGLHLTIRDFFTEKTTATRAAAVALFAIVWAALVFYAFYDMVNPPTPILQTDLHANAPPTSVPLHGVPGSYRVVVEGHFPPTSGESHTAGYRISVARGGKTDEVFDGEFSEHWARRRLGRRGSVQTPVVHAVAQHVIDSTQGEDFTLHLDEIGTEARDAVTVSVYRSAFPTGIVVALAVAVVGAALILDAWRGSGDGTVTIGTAGALLAVAAFRWFSSPHPGFGDLIVWGGVGTLAGAILGMALWRVARKPVQRFA